ncbi:hypothetical protein [Robertmurraya siralis]|uniref:hypothetical protein n=1 Tax=Robertmurraya siralis TaxID=77777 RepID=UPI0010F7034C|nr:hypothetical protein [Robertmurraya siralis]
MEKLITDGNKTMYFLNEDLLLTIEKLAENKFLVENQFNKLIGTVTPIDDFKTEIILEKNFKKDTLGRWRNTKKLFSCNMTWFSYILQEKGFVRKAKAI